jgi:hypothetical protein
LLRDDHRQIRKVVNDHLLHHDNVPDVPDDVVVEAMRYFVELLQSMIVEEFNDVVPTGPGNRKGALHFLNFSIKISNSIVK